jgi:hypothetical protein
MRKPSRSPKARLLRKRLLPFWQTMELKSPTPQQLDRALGLVLGRDSKTSVRLPPAVAGDDSDTGQK